MKDHIGNCQEDFLYSDFSRNYSSWHLYGVKWHKQAVGVEFLSLNLLILQSAFGFPQLENILKQY